MDSIAALNAKFSGKSVILFPDIGLYEDIASRSSVQFSVILGILWETLCSYISVDGETVNIDGHPTTSTRCRSQFVANRSELVLGSLGAQTLNI